MSQDFSLPKHKKLRKKSEFDAVFAHDRKIKCKLFVLYGMKNGLEFSRFARIVSKKWGKAVWRNKLRRWYQEAFRVLQYELPSGIDYVLVPLFDTDLSFDWIRQELLKSGKKLAGKL